MYFRFDDAARAVYIGLGEETHEPVVARTTEEVPGRLMVDFDRSGHLLGIEILDPTLLSRVPGILQKNGISPPYAVRFDKLSEALMPAPATSA